MLLNFRKGEARKGLPQRPVLSRNLPDALVVRPFLPDGLPQWRQTRLTMLGKGVDLCLVNCASFSLHFNTLCCNGLGAEAVAMWTHPRKNVLHER